MVVKINKMTLEQTIKSKTTLIESLEGVDRYKYDNHILSYLTIVKAVMVHYKTELLLETNSRVKLKKWMDENKFN